MNDGLKFVFRGDVGSCLFNSSINEIIMEAIRVLARELNNLTLMNSFHFTLQP